MSSVSRLKTLQNFSQWVIEFFFVNLVFCQIYRFPNSERKKRNNSFHMKHYHSKFVMASNADLRAMHRGIKTLVAPGHPVTGYI